MPHPKRSVKTAKHHKLETAEVVSQYMALRDTSDVMK